MPHACQIVRGTTGNTGKSTNNPPSVDSLPSQFSFADTLKEPKLPKLIALRMRPARTI